METENNHQENNDKSGHDENTKPNANPNLENHSESEENIDIIDKKINF